MKDLVKKEENNNWTSKKELMNNLQISSDTIEQILSDLSCRRPADTQSHIKKGGYLYAEPILQQFQLWLMKNQATQMSSLFYCIMKKLKKQNL